VSRILRHVFTAIAVITVTACAVDSLGTAPEDPDNVSLLSYVGFAEPTVEVEADDEVLLRKGGKKGKVKNPGGGNDDDNDDDDDDDDGGGPPAPDPEPPTPTEPRRVRQYAAYIQIPPIYKCQLNPFEDLDGDDFSTVTVGGNGITVTDIVNEPNAIVMMSRYDGTRWSVTHIGRADWSGTVETLNNALFGKYLAVAQLVEVATASGSDAANFVGSLTGNEGGDLSSVPLGPGDPAIALLDRAMASNPLVSGRCQLDSKAPGDVKTNLIRPNDAGV